MALCRVLWEKRPFYGKKGSFSVFTEMGLFRGFMEKGLYLIFGINLKKRLWPTAKAPYTKTRVPPWVFGWFIRCVLLGA